MSSLKLAPLITIITIVYNDKNAIEKTLRSVISQTYAPIEYIVVDGGSSDGTLEIINQYKDKINHVISEPDKGIYDAMNKGILMASGTWINFMNAGDCFYDKTSVMQVVKRISGETTYKIFYGNCIWKKEGKDIFVQAQSPRKVGRFMPSCHQAFFIETKLHKKYLYNENYKIAADYEFFLKMYRSGVKFLKIPVTVAIYQGGGVSESNLTDKHKEYIEIYNRYNTKWQQFWITNFYTSKFFNPEWYKNYILAIWKKIPLKEK
ncbi:MAG: glycosyltransferase [Candidatus Azobacteroides sp.]|nr:glycosyltransferase [Candidatus Azobacteroides sp.]